MGLLSKIKNIFYDEEIVEVPVQAPVKNENKPKIEEVTYIKTEVAEVKKEEPRTMSSFSERELFKNEPTFNFPIFEDEEEKEIPKRSASIDLNRTRVSAPYKETPRNEAKIFKPSPIISPIYGILDKNYKKEEIIERKELPNKNDNKELDYDYVRRKAYGTLEDELENTLTKAKAANVERVIEKVEEINKSAEDIENLLSKIEKNATVSIGEIEEAIKDQQEEEEIEEVDNTLEHDLFNLIDSMYDDKEE